MNADLFRTAAFALLLPASALAQGAGAQGFAGLGAEAQEFAQPDRARTLAFPRDHGPHPDYRIEWWYLTATLTGADGRDYGAQWTLFRAALAPGDGTGWETPQVWMAHAAVTTPDTHLHDERFARGGIGQAGVTVRPLEAWIDDWRMISHAADGDPLDALRITARGMNFAYDLTAEATGPLVLHGDAGFSVKSSGGQASHYYSQPFYGIAGTLILPEGEVAVTGEGWLDREWSSQPLEGEQTGWDWFALHLDSGAKLMAAQVRDDRGGFPFGTWIERDGTARPLDDLAFEPLALTDIGGRTVPTSWRIRGPGIDIETTPVNAQAWMDTTVTYWEGPIRVTGSHTGRGFLEMTGY